MSLRIMHWDNETDMICLKQALDQNGVFVTTTDTVLGLLGNCTESSYLAFNDIKQRVSKPYLLLISSPEKLPLFVEMPLADHLALLIERYWPGPLTIIFKAKKDLPYWLKAEDDTIAIRMPDHKGLLHLLVSYNGLFSTSANLHSQPIPQIVEDLDAQIVSKIDGVCIDSVSSYQSSAVSSTIIDCSGDSIKVIRAGSLMENKHFVDAIGL